MSHFLLELSTALHEITQCLKKASLSLLGNTLIIYGRLYGSMLTKPPRITLQASVPISCLLKIVMPILHNQSIGMFHEVQLTALLFTRPSLFG